MIDKTKPTYLDLGCGDNKITKQILFENGVISNEDKDKEIVVIGIDNRSTEQVDLIHDLTQFPYPFGNESVNGAMSSHFVEHLTGYQRIKFFDEMYRILKPGGKMRHVHPYYKSPRAIQDPTHQWPPIAEESYLYWQKWWRDANKLSHYLGTCDYEIKIGYILNNGEWQLRNEEGKNFAMAHYWNIISDMIVDMTKK